MLSRWFPRALLALEVAVSTVLIATHFWPLWQARWIQDDAYISFRYAKHLVQGHGLVYNIGAHVEGYTNFLWTLLSAIPLAIGASDPIIFMHLLSAALWLATYAVLLRLGIRLFAAGIWSAPLALVPLLAHYSYNQWFLSGMETPLVCFLTVAAVYFLCLNPERHPRALFLASLCGVALTMTRADGIVTIAAFALAGVLLHGRIMFRAAHRRRYLVAPLLPVVLVYVPFNLWRVWYYGSFYPNTYYAKAAYLSFYERGWTYLMTYLDVYPFLRFLPLLVAALVLAQGMVRRFLWTTALCGVAVSFYVTRLGGDFMEWRFLTPITGVLYPALVVGADATANWLGADWRGRSPSMWSRALGTVAGAAVAATLFLLTQQATPTARNTTVPGQESIPLLGRYCDARHFNWGEVGKLFDSVLPQNITIATTSAGIIPFFCDRTCIDLHGLTDAQIARVPVDSKDRGRMGHEHWLSDLGTIRERGADVFLPWAARKPHALALVTPPVNGTELVSARLPSGDYVELQILNRAAVDVKALRADPRLVFYGDVKTAPPGEMQTWRDRFNAFEVVDSLDVQNGDSHNAHEFEELWMPGAEPLANFHPKMLQYAAPAAPVTVYDDGRIINYQARWTVDHVAADRDLVMVVRYDRTGAGVYGLDVNGKPAPGELRFASGAEAWDERWIEIPAALLVDGRNQFLLRRTSTVSSEIYFIWFLQPRAG